MKKILIFCLALGLWSCQNHRNTTNKSPLKEKIDTNSSKGQHLTGDESLYQIPNHFINQDNETVHLQDLEGKPVVVSMIYTTCGSACPALIADLKKIEKQLGIDKNQVRFLLISFDVQRDNPKVLKEFAQEHQLGSNWTLLHGDEEVVRTISVLLNTPFAKDAEGHFSHGNLISVLDQKGALRYQLEGLGNAPDETTAFLKTLFPS